MVGYVERALQRSESTEIDQAFKIEDLMLHSNSFYFLYKVMRAEVYLEDIFFNFPQNNSF